MDEYKKKFYDIYNKDILPKFREYESDRKRQLRKLLFVLIICLCIVFTMVVHILFFANDSSIIEIEI